MEARIWACYMVSALALGTSWCWVKASSSLEDATQPHQLQEDDLDAKINMTLANETILDTTNLLGDKNCSYDLSCYNSSEVRRMWEELWRPKHYVWILVSFHTVVFIIGLVGNALVCAAVYRNHSMRTVTNYFIVNLAIADFMVILFCLPPTVLWDVTEQWILGDVLCKVVPYVQNVSVAVSVLTLTFISLDRWYAICFPLKFKSTTGRAKTAIIIIWLLGLSFVLPELIVLETRDIYIGVVHVSVNCVAKWSNESDKVWSIVKIVFLYLVPLVFMSIAYFQIVRVLWQPENVPVHLDQSSMGTNCGRRVNTFTMNANTSTEGQLRSRRKAAKMLVAVVAMFAVCYFPVHLYTIVSLNPMPRTDVNKALILITHWLCYFNSAVNPLIYNFMSGKYRREFRRAFAHCCRRRGAAGGAGRRQSFPMSQSGTSVVNTNHHLQHHHQSTRSRKQNTVYHEVGNNRSETAT